MRYSETMPPAAKAKAASWEVTTMDMMYANNVAQRPYRKKTTKRYPGAKKASEAYIS
jgi:hypothetical protein